MQMTARAQGSTTRTSAKAAAATAPAAMASDDTASTIVSHEPVDTEGVWEHSGRPSSVLAIRERAEEEGAALVGELDHRVQNILAVVSAVIAQTLRRARRLLRSPLASVPPRLPGTDFTSAS
jgi:two-component sensor histidine kinase